MRFKEKSDGPFLSTVGKRVPPLVELPRLLSATARVIDEKEPTTSCFCSLSFNTAMLVLVPFSMVMIGLELFLITDEDYARLHAWVTALVTRLKTFSPNRTAVGLS